MKSFFLTLLCLLPCLARAEVISPSSVEVKFSFTAEFQTARAGSARDLALTQAKYLFGYLQNPEIGPTYGLDKRIGGIGAPRWEPAVRVDSDSAVAGTRTIRYGMTGRLLLQKAVAEQLLPKGELDVSLPYELDRFYDEHCVDPDDSAPESFWYFYSPFRDGCQHLREAPLARPVAVQLLPAPAVADRPVGLDVLRGGNNGNGDVFQIASINGFDESSTKRTDDGRENFMAMNAWLREQGFRMTILQHFKNRPVYLFEKTLTRADGSPVQARVLRLLADTDVDESTRVTFAKFLKEALEDSDVVIYEGHSGMGVNLDLSALEARLLLSRDPHTGEHIEFNRTKHQIYLFDACSSYSYYLGMFEGKKDPGTLAVMSNGLESEFGYEIPMTKHLYTELFDLGHARLGNDELPWSQLLSEFERPLRGNTFMLNVDLN